MIEWVENTVQSFGYAGIVLLMFLENIFPPIPSEIIMPFAGSTAHRGLLSFWGVVLAGTTGTVLGALPWYFLGRAIGPERLKNLVRAHGRWLRIKVADVDRAQHWFDRWGAAAVFVGRLVPGIRTLISIPAGFAQMPLIPFLAWTSLGSFGWTLFLAGCGWFLRDQYPVIEPYVSTIGMLAIAVVVVWFIAWVLNRRRKSPGSTGQEPDDGAAG
jgi:membrane protein DedA with SNARE-associated domain